MISTVAFYLSFKEMVIKEWHQNKKRELQDDFSLKVFRDLQKAGYRDAMKEDAVYQYFNLRKRQVEKKPIVI